MNWIEIKVIYHSDDNLDISDIISNIFYEFGLSGVVIEEPGIEPEEGWGDDAIKPSGNYSVAGYFPNNNLYEKRRLALEEKLIILKTENHIDTVIKYTELDEEDWSESWKEYFWPEKISDRIVVRPTWRDYTPEKDEIIIDIDPGMAFGTGTHPTTSLCINTLEKYLKPGGSVLDVGTGSGILLIAAGKLGASKLCGIDNDEVAAEIAKNNLLLNGFDTSDFEIITGDLIKKIEVKFDIVVANILSGVIINLLDNIKSVIHENSILIFSGIIEDNKDSVLKKMKETGLEIVEVISKETWVSITGRPIPEDLLS
ncbi:MAG: 50S ribosomal protein L11 methyltransferase [Desulfobacterales bacterium]|jgi:ribosomal protein L11 methyltransferase|nr:50S ribosomal protein L11 methyltransferase [Desulfobacteraceae bacterium]MBT4364308.1 50S ribosomal protein L11 methyltransferase [Desulfobacteraceae bacterium]MBT7084889.1 50S ribosomal protein L11 methyltransferase [Desulfobacterales bacterium]MBT7698287.1 50S ribosomal protein L11 methyltransferase [Desulfobacterales bacterium]